MKKIIALVLCLVLVIGIPLSTSARSRNHSTNQRRYSFSNFRRPENPGIDEKTIEDFKAHVREILSYFRNRFRFHFPENPCLPGGTQVPTPPPATSPPPDPTPTPTPAPTPAPTPTPTVYKTVEVEISQIPEFITEGDDVVITFTTLKMSDTWELTEILGILNPATAEDPLATNYITTALLDTSEPGNITIGYSIKMTDLVNNTIYTGTYTSTVLINEKPMVTYYWNQDFESDYNGWITGGTNGNIILDSGHAILSGGFTNAGPYSFFDGSGSEWNDGWYSSIRIYLDPAAMTSGEGFNYTAACNEPDSTLLEGFTFYIAANSTSDAILVGGSNTSSPVLWTDISALGNHIEITTAGWYTLLHYFHESGGNLSVSLSLTDSEDNTLFTETIDTSYAIATEVGGSRYGWFTKLIEDDGLMIDDFQRYKLQ